MTLNEVLMSLLEAIGATGESPLVGWDTAQQWPDDALGKLLETGILTKAKPALSIECQTCPNRCLMAVHQLASADNKAHRTFVVCDHPEMQEQIGRIEIPTERLRQWKVTALQLARVIAGLLDIECKAEDRHGLANVRIGMVKGKNGRHWLSLSKSPLILEVDEQHLPLEEVLFFEHGVLRIDQPRISQLIDKAPGSGRKKYQPSTKKREAGKRTTEAMYEDWQEEYLRLRREHPDTVRHTDKWISKQIAKLEIARGRDSETIRKNMKP